MKTPIFTFALLAALGFLAAIPSAQAFHINEHLAITDRAVIGLQKCGLLPNSWDMTWKETIAAADKAEDIDIIRKMKYSHYFNPNHALNQPGRVDSSVTISESLAEIQTLLGGRNELDVYKLVGRIVHHIQDSAVPAHAVPVAHLATDGFEKMDMTAFFGEPFSLEECATLAAADPMDILKQSALASLAALEQPVVYSLGGEEIRGVWSREFWAYGEGLEFGKYGNLGDVFGQASITLRDNRVIHVDPAQYVTFKRAQLNLAVRATQNVILWANKALQP